MRWAHNAVALLLISVILDEVHFCHRFFDCLYRLVTILVTSTRTPSRTPTRAVTNPQRLTWFGLGQKFGNVRHVSVFF